MCPGPTPDSFGPPIPRRFQPFRPIRNSGWFVSIARGRLPAAAFIPIRCSLIGRPINKFRIMKTQQHTAPSQRKVQANGLVTVITFTAVCMVILLGMLSWVMTNSRLTARHCQYARSMAAAEAATRARLSSLPSSSCGRAAADRRPGRGASAASTRSTGPEKHDALVCSERRRWGDPW